MSTNWEKTKNDIHGSFLVMLHSVPAFPEKTAGETAQKVIKVFEEYAFPLLAAECEAAEKRGYEKGLTTLESNYRRHETEARIAACQEIAEGLKGMMTKDSICYCKTHPEHNCNVTSNEAISDALSLVEQIKQKGE